MPGRACYQYGFLHRAGARVAHECSASLRIVAVLRNRPVPQCQYFHDWRLDFNGGRERTHSVW